LAVVLQVVRSSLGIQAGQPVLHVLGHSLGTARKARRSRFLFGLSGNHLAAAP